MPESRRYSEAEISAILKDAAERQRRSATGTDTGLTLEELQAIAREAGIDPIHILAAASAMDVEHETTIETSKFIRFKKKVEFIRVIDGEIPVDELDDLFVPIIREVMGLRGTFEQLGPTLSWAMNHLSRSAPVQVTSQNGKTRIHLEVPDLKVLYYLTLLMPVLPLFIGTIALITGNQAPFVILGTVALSLFTVFNIIFRTITRVQQGKLQKLADRLEEAARDAVLKYQSTSDKTIEATKPLIQLDDENTTEEAQAVRRANRTR